MIFRNSGRLLMSGCGPVGSQKAGGKHGRWEDRQGLRRIASRSGKNGGVALSKMNAIDVTPLCE